MAAAAGAALFSADLFSAEKKRRLPYIDAHSHIWEEKLMSPDMEKIINEVGERFKPSDMSQLRDGTIERLLGEMDEAGIDKTVLLALDAGIAVGADAAR